MMGSEKKRARDRERMKKKRASDAHKIACLDALLSAKDVWEDYGSGFRIHFSFEPSENMRVVEMIHTARALNSRR